MIDYYGVPSTNCWKITIAMEEMGLPYKFTPVNLVAGGQKKPEFLAINPVGKVPAIVDHEPPGGGEPLAVWESGAILLYLAEKTGRFLPAEPAARIHCISWLMWQMSDFGPNLGRSWEFASELHPSAPQPDDRACRYYADASRRLHAFVDENLADREFICGDEYTIVDMSVFAWVVPYRCHVLESLSHLPNLERWYRALWNRPAVQRGMDVGRKMADALPEGWRRALFDE
jgi:GST-like protein